MPKHQRSPTSSRTSPSKIPKRSSTESMRSPVTPRSKSPSKIPPPIKNIKTTESIISQLRKREIGMLPRKRINFSKYKMFNDTKLYSIDVLHHLNDILKYNKRIELYVYNIDDNDKVNLTKYNNLCLYTDIKAQNVLYSYYDNANEFIEILHSFDLNGTNIDVKNNVKTLLNDVLIDHLYVDKNFTTLYLFNYTYYYEYKTVEQEQKKIKEEKIFSDYIKYYNVKLIKNKSNDEIDDPNFKFFDELSDEVKENHRYVNTECDYDEAADNANYNGSLSNTSNRSSYGGSDAKSKYIKSLKNKTLEKLQNIAKNKKIKFTKKLNGKMIAIKKETLIKKLCNHKYKNIDTTMI